MCAIPELMEQSELTTNGYYSSARGDQLIVGAERARSAPAQPSVGRRQSATSGCVRTSSFSFACHRCTSSHIVTHLLLVSQFVPFVYPPEQYGRADDNQRTFRDVRVPSVRTRACLVMPSCRQLAINNFLHANDRRRVESPATR